jgi:hypothetical protein
VGAAKAQVLELCVGGCQAEGGGLVQTKAACWAQLQLALQQRREGD